MLMEAEAEYRFFFNPVRYTSLPLAVCEAMTIGMPIVGLATTELVSVIRNGTTAMSIPASTPHRRHACV